MTSGIYITTNKSNGRRYVGYSENIESRWRDNAHQLDKGSVKNHPLIQSDWQKDGADVFCFGILEVLDTQEQSLLSKRSQYWKDLLKPEYNNNSREPEGATK